MTAPTHITVEVPSVLLACSGGATDLLVPAASVTSVQGVLDDLERRYPLLHRSVCDETGAVRRHVNLFVNNAHVRELRGLDTALVPGDTVTILPAVSGG